MDKNWYKSKTVIGFGVAGLIALAQVLGISWSEATVMEFAKILTALLGAYGLRDAMN